MYLNFLRRLLPWLDADDEDEKEAVISCWQIITDDDVRHLHHHAYQGTRGPFMMWATRGQATFIKLDDVHEMQQTSPSACPYPEHPDDEDEEEDGAS